MAPGARDCDYQTFTDQVIASGFGRDVDLLAAIQCVREAYTDNRRDGERMLGWLEELVLERLRDVEQQARAVADANVRGLEIFETQRELAVQLQAQNLELSAQNKRIDEHREALESQNAAMAHANVDALFMMEESESRLSEIDEARRRLSDINRLLTASSRDLEQQAVALAESNAEAVAMIDAREQAIAELSRKAAAVEVQNRELASQAVNDALTGLFNRRYFKQQVEREVARSRRYGRALSIVFIDADFFKDVNDKHGHQVGDAVLAGIGQVIASEVRGADVAVRVDGMPFAVRYGGEEFVVILPETDGPGARIAAERIRQRIEAAPLPGGAGMPGDSITVSIGVATLAACDENAEALVRRADEALYRAKHGGRNQVVVAETTNMPSSRAE